MKRRNHVRTYYPKKRRVSPPSHNYNHPASPSYRRPNQPPSYYHDRSPPPSYRRPAPPSSYYHNRSPPRSYRKPAPLPSYYHGRSPPPSYKSIQSRTKLATSHKSIQPGRNTVKKIGVGAFCFIITSFLVYGCFSIFNPIPIEGGNNSGGSSGGNLDEKIAAFFWASDDNIWPGQPVIDRYIDILEDEGYTKFFNYGDSNDFEADFQQVADFEDSNDIVFFYIIGHGYNDGQHSYTYLKAGSNRVSSNDFRKKCDSLDSSRVGLLVESCESGDWSDDMIGGGYLAISTCDETHNAAGDWNSGGVFTGAFFNAIRSGSNAIEAFSVAENGVNNQYPKLCDESAHNFLE